MFEDELVHKFFQTISDRFQSKKQLSKTDLDYVFKHAIETFGIPYPSSVLYRYFLNSCVISSLILQIHNAERLSREDRDRFHDNFINIFGKLIFPKSAHFIQHRELGYEGLYPNMSLERGPCCYTNHSNTPAMITKNNSQAEEAFSCSSEVTLLTRNELKMAVSILCAADSGLIHLYFPGYNQFSINETALQKIPQELKISFIHELVSIHNLFRTFGSTTYSSVRTKVLKTYRFVEFQKYIPFFVKIFDSFSIRNHLLMRTSFYLIKSIMLWDNRNFQEEAIANVFFCLEGCLHLIQEKHGVHQTELYLDKLSEIFANNFRNGEFLFDFIKEAYENRITIVHAKPFGCSEWSPFLMADDFYEYFQIARELLNFILIDRVIESQ